MIEHKKWILIGGLFGFTGVALGAFGAHIISSGISESLYETYKTGVLYHLIHSVIITAIGLSSYKNLNLPAIFFSIGIILFSFSLYAYSLTGNSAFAMITPFGGVSFLIGWLLLMWKAFSQK
jgi:uncharacterized membrane protein YgdD (TMEM256/DUF423 family)